MSKISFIIPVYNAEKVIKKCIRSIQKQTYKDIEIVCVNDGSKDNSLVVLNELQKQDNRIIVINQENKGAFQARKAGILASTGDYILFVDSDDQICNNDCCNIVLRTFDNNDISLVQFAVRKKKGFFVLDREPNRLGLISLEDLKRKYFKDYLSSESEGILTPTLWNKAFIGDILRGVSEDFDTELVLGEDLLLILHYLFDDRFVNMYNIDDVLYQYNEGVGYSSKLGGTILKEYGELKKYQMFLCEQWNLGEEAIFYCNLESVYFLFVSVRNMISEKIDKESIMGFIEESSKYECILLAKKCLREISEKYLFAELEFLISNYSAEEYYDYCVNNMPKLSFRMIVNRLIKRFS